MYKTAYESRYNFMPRWKSLCSDSVFKAYFNTVNFIYKLTKRLYDGKYTDVGHM